MAEQPTSSSAPAVAPPVGEDAPLTVNLHIVSPSMGVDRRLAFNGLPVTTTVGQLKARIRETLPSKPANDQQRLIHRGRLMAADNETLLKVFGEELIRSSDQQILHLVVRDQPEPPSASARQPAPARNPSPGAGAPPRPQTHTPHVHAHQQAHPHPFHPDPQHLPPHLRPPQVPGFPGQGFPMHGMPNAVPRAPYIPPGAGFGMPQAPPGIHPHHFAAHQQQQQQQQQHQQHQTMVLWMNQLQREAGYRQMLGQQQQDRAAMGMNGIQDQAGAPQVHPPDGERGRSAPGVQPMGRTVVREGVSPNGQRWRVTVNNTMLGAPAHPSPLNPVAGPHPPGTPYSAADVQNILRSADASEATRTMTNAIHRSASGASLASLGQNPGVTVPLVPGGLSRTGSSRRATPEPTARSAVPGSSSAAAAQGTSAQPPSAQPEVYILSSPHGPRALLINSGSETYFTPTATSTGVQLPFGLLARPALQIGSPFGYAGAQPQVPETQQQPQQNQQQQPAQQQAPAPAAALPPLDNNQIRAVAHPNNAGAGAVAAAMWPHLWLLVRLAAFVWWFTTPESSWSRWVTIICLALAVFIVNTGVLDRVANGAFEPFRRHVEGLLPLGHHHRQARQNAAANANNAGAAPGEPALQPGGGHPRWGGAEPDPAEAAARLVARRRGANANWVMTQVRRMERAGLLFLASIAPGVAEGHIAHLEAEARAERERQEAEERARREAEEAAAAQAAAAAQNQDEGETQGRGGGGDGRHQQHGRGGQTPAAAQPEPPLVEV